MNASFLRENYLDTTKRFQKRMFFLTLEQIKDKQLIFFKVKQR